MVNGTGNIELKDGRETNSKGKRRRGDGSTWDRGVSWLVNIMVGEERRNGRKWNKEGAESLLRRFVSGEICGFKEDSKDFS